MKKNLIFLLPLLIITLQGLSQTTCGLFIGTDFSSECLISEYDRVKPNPLLDETVCFRACQGNIVQYYAQGMSNASFEWTVQGSDNWQVIAGDAIAVTWPEGTQSGNIIVTATENSTGHTCTFNRCIELISKPNVGIQTFPDADIAGTMPVLNICLGQQVQFQDNSNASAEAPIVGYLWEWDNTAFPTQTTQNIDVTFNHPGVFILTHEIINECGCTDEMHFEVRVSESPSLQLECYGTVCANELSTYRIINMQCSDYVWDITGGDLISFNYPELTIQWGNPASGYGVIRLDGTDCNNLCDGNAYINIPIMSNQIDINGPTEICVGDIAIFQIPLYGASTYNWAISGTSTNFDNMDYTSPNQRLIRFNEPGIYHINANYLNEVLPDCGLNLAETLDVVVKDTFSISGPLRACKHELVEFNVQNTTDNFDWQVYDDNDNLIYSQQNTNVLQYSFTESGNYQVIAENSNYCREEKAYISIMPSPEAIAVENITGDQLVCPNASAIYTATPTETLYYTAWTSTCATPTDWSGEEYTANFGTSICDIGVYQVNRITGCISDTTWYDVDEFSPTVSNINVPTQACANAEFNVSVQAEENILYEWSVSPTADASVVGDVFGNQNSIQVNDINASNLIVTLTRNYCNNQDQLSETVPVIPVVEPILDFPDEICENDYLSLNVQNPSQLNGSFSWDVNGTTYTGLGSNALIDFTGDFTITLTYTPIYCDPVTVVTNMYAVPAPSVNIFDYDAVGGTALTASVQDDAVGQFDYLWSTNESTATIIVNTNGTYYCTVTNSNNCETIADISLLNNQMEDSVTGTIQLTRQIENVCGEYQWLASGYIDTPVEWTVSTPGANTTESGTDNQTLHAEFDYPGLYTITASAPDGNGNIYTGFDQIAIPCIPDFEVHFACDPANEQNILFSLNDLTAYLDNTTFSTSYYTVNGVAQSGIISLQSGNTYTITLIKQFSYTHPETDEVFAGTCTETQIITVPQRGQAAFSIEDGPQYCAGTPVTFNDLSTGNIIRWEWQFSDGASLLGQNGQRTFSTPSNNSINSLTITDSYGCTSYAEQQITVVANGLEDGLNDVGGPHCSGSAWSLLSLNQSSGCNYTWMPENLTTSSNTHNVYQTGNYYVLLEDNNGCRAQSNMVNLGFVNSPTASIHGLTSYCPDEEVQLYGNIGAQFDYMWSAVTQNGPPYYFLLGSDPNFTYAAYPGNNSGIWNNTLTVQITEGGLTCSDNVSVQTHLHEAGQAPQIDFGNNACLTYGPVDLVSNSGQVYWSNGMVSNSTQYFNSGWINAYQIDPITGCESEKAQRLIHPTTDYDGLLTGCYEKCPDWFQQSIYAFINPLPVDWNWYSSSLLAQGHTSDAYLPLPWFGDYYLKSSYPTNCNSMSPTLTLMEKTACEFDSISIKPDHLECRVSNCEYTLIASFDVDNLSATPMTIQAIDYPGAIIINHNLPINMPPMSSSVVWVEFMTQVPTPSHIPFQLSITQNGDTFYAIADMPMSYLSNPDDCFSDSCNASILAMDLLQSGSSYLYRFGIAYEIGMQNVSINADAGSILDFTYNPQNGEIVGVISLSDTWIANFCTDNTHPDFCFEITGCINDLYCTATACIGQASLCGTKSGLTTTDDNTVQETDNSLTIAPNPGKDIIRIEGIDATAIKQIQCFDLKGNIIFSDNQNEIQINHLKPATYILRVDLHSGQVHYLKFVKQ